jgi:hypothetical protein
MANSLLDFVMSLVRDPDAAAQYAANPDQALAAAHLTGVTSADVSNLIPVVSESLSMSLPAHGLGDHPFDAAVPADNVWASGAATAAFDAFGDHASLDSHHADPWAAHVPVVVTDVGGPAAPADLGATLDDLHESVAPLAFDVPDVADAGQVPDVPVDHGLVDDWSAQLTDHHLPDDHTAVDGHTFGL